MRLTPALLLAAAMAGVSPAGVRAGTVTIPPSADACLFQLNGDFNFGSDTTFPAGTLGSMAGSANSRGLFRFDIAGAIPAGATITSVSLTMRATMAPFEAVNSVFTLYPVFKDWGEGTGMSSLPGGRPAEEGEVTWNARFHEGAIWDEPGGEIGGDFSDEPSAARAVAGVGTYVFDFNATGVADVQAMLDFPEENFGWVLVSNGEGTAYTARRWASREHEDPPLLAITFTLPPSVEVPAILTFAIDHGTGSGLVAFVRKAGLAYQLEYKVSLGDPQWLLVEALPPILQDSVGVFEFAKGPDNHRFWRIQALVPGPF